MLDRRGRSVETTPARTGASVESGSDKERRTDSAGAASEEVTLSSLVLVAVSLFIVGFVAAAHMHIYNPSEKAIVAATQELDKLFALHTRVAELRQSIELQRTQLRNTASTLVESEQRLLKLTNQLELRVDEVEKRRQAAAAGLKVACLLEYLLLSHADVTGSFSDSRML
jgi:TolA-binding protein